MSFDHYYTSIPISKFIHLDLHYVVTCMHRNHNYYDFCACMRHYIKEWRKSGITVTILVCVKKIVCVDLLFPHSIEQKSVKTEPLQNNINLKSLSRYTPRNANLSASSQSAMTTIYYHFELIITFRCFE